MRWQVGIASSGGDVNTTRKDSGKKRRMTRYLAVLGSFHAFFHLLGTSWFLFLICPTGSKCLNLRKARVAERGVNLPWLARASAADAVRAKAVESISWSWTRVFEVKELRARLFLRYEVGRSWLLGRYSMILPA